MPDNVCLTETCIHPTRCRGLCNVCYSAACGVVSRGESSWNELMELGLCKEAKRRRATSLFKVQFAKRIREREGNDA